MTERGVLVVRLLACRFDWLPAVRTATGLLVEAAGARGEVRSRWVECPRCGGGKAMAACEFCGRSGRVRVDPMIDGKSKGAVERERVTGEAESVRLRRRAAAGELRRLELAELHRRGLVDPSERESWEAAKAALWREGSFAELELALAALEVADPYGRAAVEVVYGYDSPLREVGSLLQEAADRAVERVAGLMPETIRVPERAEAKAKAVGTGRHANGWARQQRDREIWRLHTVDGLNREQIAKRLGVDRSTVSRVLSAKVAA